MVDTTTRAVPSQFYVKIDTKDVPDEFMADLFQASVETSLHLPAVATLVLHDIHLRWIDDPSLLPGKPLQVAARVGADEQLLFDGEIVELEPEFDTLTQRVVVRAFDRLHRLSRGRKVRTFQQVSDSDLVEKLAAEVGLLAQVKRTPVVHRYVFQHNQTNLEFLRSRLAALGYLLFVRGKTLHCEPAPVAAGKPIELRRGAALQEFRPRLTTIGQAGEVVVRGWDPQTRQAIVAQSTNGAGAPKIGEQRSGGQLARDVFKLPAQQLVTDRPLRQQAAADALSQATARELAGTFVEAEGACAGDPNVQAGATVQVAGVGERFSGTYLVTGATHLYGLQGFRTQFTVSGQHPATLLSLLARATDASNGSQPGLVIGVVTDNQDPEGQGRVKVMFPWLSAAEASDWARVVAPGGGAERGLEFLPEVNDEVLVGFEQGDMHYPYVLGGLWNGRDAPPLPTSQAVGGGRVQKRVIRSRTGHTITLDDSDGGGGVTIEDKAGNTIKLDTRRNALEIEVQGNVSVTARGNLTLEAQGQIEIKGLGVKIDGGAATVDVKGSVINLN